MIAVAVNHAAVVVVEIVTFCDTIGGKWFSNLIIFTLLAVEDVLLAKDIGFQEEVDKESKVG